MTKQEILEKSRMRMQEKCKACPIGNDRAFRHQILGPGAKGQFATRIGGKNIYFFITYFLMNPHKMTLIFSHNSDTMIVRG